MRRFWIATSALLSFAGFWFTLDALLLREYWVALCLAAITLSWAAVADHLIRCPICKEVLR